MHGTGIIRGIASLVEGQKLTKLHFYKLNQLLIFHRIDLVQEAHNARHSHLQTLHAMLSHRSLHSLMKCAIQKGSRLVHSKLSCNIVLR